MRCRRIVLLLIIAFFPLYTPARAGAQTGPEGEPSAPVENAGETLSAAPGPAVFPLVPLLEAAFSGELRWRPDWPADIPPDGFSLSGEQPAALGRPLSLTLSNGADTYRFRRDGAGRLREFPFFSRDTAAQVQAAYGLFGEMVSMSVSSAEPGADGEAAAAWDCVFPPDFFLYDAGSPGGVLLPVRVSRKNTVFFVFLLESPAFLSETWYDGEGNPLAYFKAPIRRENGSWRIQALHTWDAEGQRSDEYFFDSGGNISEIRSPAGIFSALYAGSRPRYWERRSAGDGEGETEPPSRFALQWDEQELLLGIRPETGVEEEAPPADLAVSADAAGPPVEFRYEYTWDAAGNWIKRQDIAMLSYFGVLAPRPGREWSRQISFSGD
jgi:hypothetical protein